MTKDLIPVQRYSGLTKTGWDLSEVTEEQWNNAGELLVKIDQARQWWLGDWFNACKWGDGREACDLIGINYKTARNCGDVSRKIQLPRRRGNLSYTHHAEVCPIEDKAIQDEFLDWAVAEKATVRALREKVQNYLKMADWSESEKERRLDVEAGKTVVANIRKGADVQLVQWAKSQGKYVFIGRGRSGIGWGNPYSINKDGNRDKVCDDHINYFRRNNSLQSMVDSLKGKVLGCYCYPERCHGDYLASLANGGKR